MTLKAIVDDLDAVPEALREHYTAGEGDLEGKFLLGVDAVDGFALENVNGLKSALSAERTKAEEAERRAKAFEGIDPDKARDALAKVEELTGIDPEKEADRLANEKFEAAKAQLVEQHTREIKEKETEIERLGKGLTKHVLESQIISAISAEKGSVNLLKPILMNEARLKETDNGFQVELTDGAGNVKIGDSSGGPMTLKQRLEEMKKDDDFARAFEASGASGGGKPPSDGGGAGGSGGNAKLYRSKMTTDEKSAYIGEHGNEKYLALPWAPPDAA